MSYVDAGEAFVSRMLRLRDERPGVLSQAIREAEHEFGMNIAVQFAQEYKQIGRKFIDIWVKADSLKTASLYAIRATKEIVEQGEADLNTRGIKQPDYRKFVETLELTEKQKDVLEKVLKIIFIISA